MPRSEGVRATIGILSPDVARQLGDTEAQRLVFEADVTTSPMNHGLSGRGLGLAFGPRESRKAGRPVSVESQCARARSSIVLPSRSRRPRHPDRGAQRLYVVPTVQVERVARRARRRDSNGPKPRHRLVGRRAVAWWR